MSAKAHCTPRQPHSIIQRSFTYHTAYKLRRCIMHWLLELLLKVFPSVLQHSEAINPMFTASCWTVPAGVMLFFMLAAGSNRRKNPLLWGVLEIIRNIGLLLWRISAFLGRALKEILFWMIKVPFYIATKAPVLGIFLLCIIIIVWGWFGFVSTW